MDAGWTKTSAERGPVARGKGVVAGLPATLLRPEFEFQVQGPPVSAQAKNRPRLRDWTTRVTTAAWAAWPRDKPPMAGDVEVYISEFSQAATRDRDNMAKPILDALQGVAYENDKQVKGVHIEWCNIGGAYVVRYMSPVVATALSVGKEFIWVRVTTHVPRTDLVR